MLTEVQKQFIVTLWMIRPGISNKEIITELELSFSDIDVTNISIKIDNLFSTINNKKDSNYLDSDSAPLLSNPFMED